MTNEPRPLNRFHFLRFVPKSVLNHWFNGSVVALVLISGGVWFIRWLEGYVVRSGEAAASTETGIFVVVCFFSFLSFFAGRTHSSEGGLFLLPLSQAHYAYLCGVESAVFSLVWILTPALCLLHFSGFSANHLSWIVILWFAARFVQPIGLGFAKIGRTYIPPERREAAAVWYVIVVIFGALASMGVFADSEFVRPAFEGIGERLEKAFSGEEGLYRNPPLGLTIVFAALAIPAWSFCRFAYSLEVPTQPALARTRTIESKDGLFLDGTDAATSKTRPDSFPRHFSLWGPAFLWASLLSVIAFFCTRGFEGYIGFLSGLELLAETKPSMTLILLFAGAHIVIFLGVCFLPARNFMRQAALIGESIRYDQLMPARCVEVVASTLMGIAITMTMFSIGLLTDEKAGMLERVFMIACLTPIVGCLSFAFCLAAGEEIMGPSTGRRLTEIQNLYVRREHRPSRFLEPAVGLAPIPLCFAAGFLQDQGNSYFAAAVLAAIALYSLWAMAWIWKRY